MSAPTEEPMKLAGDFAAADDAQWVTLAAKVLNKGRPDGRELSDDAVLERLRTTLPGGLVTEALYTAGDEPRPLGHPGSMPFTRGLGPVSRDVPWDVRQLHDDPDPVSAHQSVMTDLTNGVTSLWFPIGAGGLAPADLPTVVQDVLLDLAPVVVSSDDDQLVAARALAAVFRAAPIEPGQARGNLGLDPIGLAARVGGPADLTVLDTVAEFSDLTGVQPVVVDARVHHDAGGTVVDEIGSAVATGIAYLRRLEQAGVGPADAARLIEFRISATDDQFLTTAALRALRRLWATVGAHSGVPAADRGARIHAVTSWRMITRDDPWVNILRGTLACFGSAVGGAQAVTTLPFDTAAGLPDLLARRIARNTQILLAEESHVAAVADPAGGSWYVEDLTDQVAAAAWAWVQELEAAGGIATALTGLVPGRLAAARTAADEALATRAQPVTGVSMFPPLQETPLHRAPRADTPTGGLPRRRDAELFEALRDRSSRIAGAGAAPAVFLATLGTHRDFGARQTFATSLLAVAGVGATQGTAAEYDGAPLVVLCSSPAGYAEHGAESVAALRASGAQQVWVAGRAAELGETEVDGELFAGVDVVALLSQFLDTLEAAQ